MNNVSLHELTITPKPSILAQFKLNDSYFFIICCENYSENFSKLDSTILNETTFYSVVGRIEVDGKYYLIVKTKNVLKNTEPSLSELLTERELQIAAFVALGWSNKQIAKRLHISEWTVSTHLRRIFVKLNVDSRAAMVYRCASVIQVMLQNRNFT